MEVARPDDASLEGMGLMRSSWHAAAGGIEGGECRLSVDNGTAGEAWTQDTAANRNTCSWGKSAR